MKESRYFKSFFQYTQTQKRGIFMFVVAILVLQIIYFATFFSSSEINTSQKQQWLSLQQEHDSVSANQQVNSYKIYSFNPNFITDFKGYKLGMQPHEIDKLLAYRKQGKFVNSAKEFQAVTGVSDSLLQVISPYFKFPDWVTNRNTSGNATKNSNWKEYPKKEELKILDINQASKDDLMKVFGIGDAISDRIIKQKEDFGGFVSMEQMQDIWGLSPEVIENLNKYFKIFSIPNVKKIDINNASIKELGQFYYFKYPISKNIVVYRSMNGDISYDDLKNIKGFPVEKIKIISLYLNF